VTGRFYEQPADGARRSAPAALRNREPIAAVLAEWLPPSGLVVEVASGTGEHAVFFAERFPDLEWQSSDMDDSALGSIAAWREASALPNLLPPLRLSAADVEWPIATADALLNINMIHISPWMAALGLLDGAARLLPKGAPLILYGPWMRDSVETAPTNLAFDDSLKQRNPEWGLRRVEEFAAEARARGLDFEDQREMPANNLMLLFRRK
jgi:hypothetical protein